MKNLHVMFDSRENEFKLYDDFTLLETAFSYEEIEEKRKEKELESEIECFECEEFGEFETENGNEKFLGQTQLQLNVLEFDFNSNNMFGNSAVL